MSTSPWQLMHAMTRDDSVRDIEQIRRHDPARMLLAQAGLGGLNGGMHGKLRLLMQDHRAFIAALRSGQLPRPAQAGGIPAGHLHLL